MVSFLCGLVFMTFRILSQYNIEDIAASMRDTHQRIVTNVYMRPVTFLCDCRLGLGLAFDLFAQRSILHFSLPSSTVICCESVRIWSRGLLCAT